jgi:hypothetical protein
MNPRATDTTTPTATPAFAPTRSERLRAAAGRMRQPWAQASDFYPQDDRAVEAWIQCRARCAEDRAHAAGHLEAFIDEHAATLDDLIWRVHFRNGPATLLDDIARTIERVLA